MEIRKIVSKAKPILSMAQMGRKGYTWVRKLPLVRGGAKDVHIKKNAKKEAKAQDRLASRQRHKYILRTASKGGKVLVRFVWKIQKKYF